MNSLYPPPPEPLMSICFLWYAELAVVAVVVFYSIIIVITYDEIMHFPFCFLREVHLALFSVTIRYVISIPKWYKYGRAFCTDPQKLDLKI